MSLRLRALSPVDQPAFAWSETIRELAEVHRSRRAVDESSRWPLAHACTHVRHVATDGERTDRVLQPFCCRALA